MTFRIHNHRTRTSVAEKVKVPRPSRLVNARNTDATTRKLVAQSASNSRFLQLPPEIRNRIYRFALGGKVIHVVGDWGKRLHVQACKYPADGSSTAKNYASEESISKFHTQHQNCGRGWIKVDKALSLQLLLVSRLIYNEAALVAFAANTWCINTDLGGLQKFMFKLMPCQKRAIHQVELIWPLRYRMYKSLPKSVIGIGKNFVGLRRLRVVAQLDKVPPIYLQHRESKDLEKCSKMLPDLAHGQLDIVKLYVVREKGEVSAELQKRFADMESFMRLSKMELDKRRMETKQAKAEKISKAREEAQGKKEAEAERQAKQQEVKNASRSASRIQRGLRALKKS